MGDFREERLLGRCDEVSPEGKDGPEYARVVCFSLAILRF